MPCRMGVEQLIERFGIFGAVLFIGYSFIKGFSPAPAAFGRLLATGLRPRSAGGLKSCPKGAIVTGRASSV